MRNLIYEMFKKLVYCTKYTKCFFWVPLKMKMKINYASRLDMRG